MGFVIQFLIIIAFLSWVLYLWAHVEHFGPQFYLNDKVRYKLLFVDINPTTTWVHHGCLSVAILIAVLLVITFGVSLWAILTKRRHEPEGEESDNWECSVSVSELMDWHYYVSLFPILCVIRFFFSPQLVHGLCLEPRYTLLSC